MKSNIANNVLDESAEENSPLKYVKIELTELLRVVPVVEFAFHDAIPGDRDPMLEIYDPVNIWDQGIGCNVQPMSNAVRILIRPDVSKKDVKRVLRKAIRIIDQDQYDWGQETDNFLNQWKEEIAAKKRRNAVR